MTVPYTTLEQRGLQTPESLMEIPGPNAHPVLIAKYMLLLASLLRHLHPDLHKKIKGLSESPRAVMERLADLAIGHVTTNDELLGSIEGLESVMIESVYHANVGSLRRSWLTGRRAMNIAQLMGINRLDHQAHYKVLDTRTKYDLPLMWFRIVFLDRYLCLMLGLSQGSLDRSMASDGFLASDTPMGRLERIHCVIASRILERNETQPSAEGLALTRTLDVELQKAARSLPSKWWLTPNLTAKPIDPQALFWSARRLSAQLLHYNLLNQLHLPYILRSSSSDRRYEYSLIACVNASREVLSRFIALRSFDGFAYNCRTVDFLALMAAMTLLLAHLDSNLSETDNLLAHQYHSDRAMIEKVQENMKEVNRLNSDTLSAKSANLLCKLLTIEVETADGYPHSAGVVSVQEVGGRATPSDQDDDAVVSVHIPYFGIIKIAREGISKAIPLSQDPAPLTGTSAFSPTTGGGVSTGRTDDTHRDSAYRTSALALSRSIEVPSSAILTPIDTSYGAASSAHSNPYSRSQGHGQIGVRLPPVNGINSAATHLTLQQNEEGLSHSILEHDIYPGLAAGVEDWAFQGVDLAFFESLMRSTAGLGGNAMGVGL
ncbi:hypothetical protein MMC25_006353 [Agyrium rufum]|nr:hypothetical protein [Agyrium rufum]